MAARKAKKPAHIELFTDFIERSGCEILVPTSEWEVLRFRASGVTGIVYRKQNGVLTYSGAAKDAYDAFVGGKTYEAGEKNRAALKKRSVLKRTLLSRDGNACFYCGKMMQGGAETLEHLLSLKFGGKHHVANLVLADKACNQRAGSLSLIEKIKLRDSIRQGGQHNG